MKHSIWIGWDPREAAAFAVARSTVQRHLNIPIPVYGLVLDDLVERGLYTRPMVMKPSAADKPVMWDVISDAPMSTQHANARFLVPHLAGSGWALFMDGDMLVRTNLGKMFDGLDRSKAVYCVKHQHRPNASVKMDGQTQTSYSRKNWSSFLVFNVDHAANRRLTLDMVNSLPGRDLHRLCWLEDHEIGELDQEYNFLVGYTDLSFDPKVIHFTEGCPDMDGYENVAFADEWRKARNDWARGSLRFG